MVEYGHIPAIVAANSSIRQLSLVAGKGSRTVEITIEEALQRPDLAPVDVRSPGEFLKASIPGAVNVPLFEDREHRRLGLTYHHMGEAEARVYALASAAPRLPVLVDSVSKAVPGKIPLLYCRRGGLRSLSLYQVLALAGIRAYRLKGGYRAYRRYVLDRLGDYQVRAKLVVLHGLTGTGKTEVLRELGRRGVAVIDLEELAGHRGSVFGAVGLPAGRSQKDFDALLLCELERHRTAEYLVLEGEGRRIGNIYLPAFLAEAMGRAQKILLTASLETRAARIVGTYLSGSPSGKTLEALEKSLCSLQNRLGNSEVERLLQLLRQGNYHAVAAGLCACYYDRYYNDARQERTDYQQVIDATSIGAATDAVVSFLAGNDRPVGAAARERPGI